MIENESSDLEDFLSKMPKIYCSKNNIQIILQGLNNSRICQNVQRRSVLSETDQCYQLIPSRYKVVSAELNKYIAMYIIKMTVSYGVIYIFILVVRVNFIMLIMLLVSIL